MMLPRIIKDGSKKGAKELPICSPHLKFGSVGDSLGNGEISSSQSVQPFTTTLATQPEGGVSLIGLSNGVFTVNIHAKAHDIVSSLRVLNDTVGSTQERVTGTSILSMKASFVEMKMCLESTLTVLLGVIEKLHGHSDIEHLEIQETGGVMESRQRHFYESLSLHLPPDLIQDAGSSFPSDSRKLESSSSEIKIKAEVNRMHSWIRQQSYIPSEETLRRISEQNEMIKSWCPSLNVPRAMPKRDRRGTTSPPNNHRKVSVKV
jgi:hypothetical protein